MTIREYINKVDEWQLASIESLFTYYRAILDFENRKISLNTYVTLVEEYLGTKTNLCKSCSSSIKKFHSDFQQIIFTTLYKSYNAVFIQIDTEKLKGVKNFGRNGLTLITASFENINIVLNGFKNDYSRKTYNLSLEEYKEIYAYVQSIITTKKNFFESDYYTQYKEALSEPVNYDNAVVDNVVVAALLDKEECSAVASTSTTPTKESKPKAKKNKKDNNSSNNN